MHILLLILAFIALCVYSSLKNKLHKEDPSGSGNALDDASEFMDRALVLQKAKEAFNQVSFPEVHSIGCAMKLGKHNMEVEARSWEDPRSKELYLEALGQLRAVPGLTKSSYSPVSVRPFRLPDIDSDLKYTHLIKEMYSAQLEERLQYFNGIRKTLEKDSQLEKHVKEALGQLVENPYDLWHLIHPTNPRNTVNRVGNILDAAVGTSNAVTNTTNLVDKALYATNWMDLTLVKQPIQLKGDRELIKAQALTIGVPYLLHFTRAVNLTSIMANGLYPIERIHEIGASQVINDHKRLDGYLNSTSVSIGFPNYKMLYRLRMEDPTVDWAILAIEPSVLWEKNCAFCRYNAADSRIRSQRLSNLTGPQAFKGMYDEVEGTPLREAENLKTYDPTDVQAEVLVFDVIEPQFIAGVIFEKAAARDSHLPNFDRQKTNIQDIGSWLFASRKYARTRGY